MLKRFWQPGARVQIVVIAILLLLLPLLAILQYRWLGQLSTGEHERMKNSLRSAATRLGQEFDRTLTKTYLTFLPGPDVDATSVDNSISFCAAAYSAWHETTSHPKLIKSIHFVTAAPVAGAEGNLKVLGLDAATKQFSVSQWPDEMSDLRSKLEENAAIFHRFQALGERAAPSDRPHPPPQLEPNLPALIVPLVNQVPSAVQGQQPKPIVSYIIVALDLESLRQELLPTLVQSHFAESGNYDLAIETSGNKRRLIYHQGTTGSSIGWDFNQDDVTTSLFSLNTDEIRQTMRSRFERHEQSSSARDKNNASRPNGNRMPVPAFMLAMRGPGQPGTWQLHLKHRAGSLEAAVAKVRRRNIGISFGILAVLAASVSLLLILVRRTGRLAQQQMDFVAGISHELRTPLAVIESAGWNLTNGVVKNQAQAQRYGALIQQQSSTLREMIEQVLEFASSQSGRQRFNQTPTNVTEVIDKVLDDSQTLLAEGGFTVEKEIADEIPLVLADQPALARAIQNLMTNAMKYGGESGWIGIRAASVTKGKEKEIQITVSDKGHGIAPEDLPHIFEPFYRSSEVRAAQIHGNGLGLSLVKNIITAHGGHISVDTKVGSGTSFTVHLPAMALNETKSVLSPSSSTVSGSEVS
ncbi:MAG TPA: HAMP domain-containing sensor histidine kinase [Blastocatellia bacterium]|nr:HAMP domain-containing sensor histidine kinase [Blastocatellia bacterium]